MRTYHIALLFLNRLLVLKYIIVIFFFISQTTKNFIFKRICIPKPQVDEYMMSKSSKGNSYILKVFSDENQISFQRNQFKNLFRIRIV